MSQASSAQREPSMEEILASIRRIIEESDTAAARAPAADAAATPTGDDAPEESPEGGVIEVDAFRSELRDRAADVAAESTATDQAADSAPPVSLADVQASVRSEPSAAGPDADTGADPVDPIAAAFESDKLVRPQPTEYGDASPPEPFDTETAAVDEAGPHHHVSVATDEPPHAEAAREPEPEPGQPEHNARPALISEHPGRQVAAAFGELSEAFAAGRRKNFDEMAEEMLRPMLQDWLDNNLPTLVERLVREEIERVARGASQ